MSRKLLERLGLALPMFPVTSVGSFPKPPYLKKARTDYAERKVDQEFLEQQEEKATRFWVEWQDQAGVDVIVDGEMYRGDMVTFFAETMKGFEIGGLVRSYGNRYYHKPIITGEVEWVQPITTEWYRFAQSLTKKPVKGMLTGPYTLMDWSFNEFYDSRRDAALALARQVRREVEALVQAGCRIIQIDEPAVSVRSEELPLAVEALGVCTAGIDAYFITHICYGTFEKIYPQLLDLPVHNLDLEMSNSQLDLLPLLAKNPPTKDVSFGLVDVHSHMLETPEVVLARLEEALAVVPPEGLWCDPDCGLKTRTTDEAQGKILAIVAAARMLRERKAGQ
jgi:5-methyltetrahydropteroyltriglutamate--homocysteine methyltransferase